MTLTLNGTKEKFNWLSIYIKQYPQKPFKMSWNKNAFLIILFIREKCIWIQRCLYKSQILHSTPKKYLIKSTNKYLSESPSK